MRSTSNGPRNPAMQQGGVFIYGPKAGCAAIEQALQSSDIPYYWLDDVAEAASLPGKGTVLLFCLTDGWGGVGQLRGVLGRSPEARVIAIAKAMPAELGTELLESGLADVVSTGELYRLPMLIRRLGEQGEASGSRNDAADAAALLDGLPAMVGYWDRDLRNHYANRAFLNWLGNGQAQLTGRHLSEVLGEPLYRLNLPHIEAVLRGEAQSFERTLPGPAGRDSRHYLASYIPDVRDGQVRGFFAMVSDISRLKRTEAALLRSEQRLRAVFDILPVGIALTDPEGRLVECNQATYDLLGLSRAACLARDLASPQWQFVRADGSAVPPEEFPGMQALRLGRAVHDMEFGYVLPGTFRWLSISAMPIDLPGHGVIIAFVDVSRRRRLEDERQEMRRQIEKMAQEQVIYQALAGLAHSFNQPLSAVAFYLENALKQVRAGRPEAAKLEAILSGGMQEIGRAGKVLQELLGHLYRPRTDTEIIDLNDMAASCMQKAMVGLGNGCRVALQLPGSRVWVKVNTQQLELILENLLRNSCEALGACGRDGGEIAVAVTAADGMACISVSDNGPGVPRHLEQRIYEPFFSTKVESAGMGLAINRTLVEAQGGKLWHEDTGRGVRFCFTVPLAR